jgi:putative DNA primase/helicase
MDAGNLETVAQAIRKLSPNAELIILADNDIKTDGSNHGVTAAMKAAQTVSGHVVIPELNGGKCDFWDVWHQLGVVAV